MTRECASPAGLLTSSDEQKIRDLVRHAHDAQGDPDALPALHTDQAVIVNLAGRRVLGAAVLADAMRAALGSPLRDVRTTVEITDVRPLGRDTALVSCVKTVQDDRSEDSRHRPLPSRAALSYVLVKDGADWRIALAQTTPILE